MSQLWWTAYQIGMECVGIENGEKALRVTLCSLLHDPAENGQMDGCMNGRYWAGLQRQ